MFTDKNMRRKRNLRSFWLDGSMFTPPRARLFAATVVAFGVLLILPLAPSERAVAERNNLPIELPLPPTEQTDKAQQAVIPSPELAQTPQAATEPSSAPASSRWREDSVRPGDNLTSLFKRLHLSETDALAVTDASREAAQLKKLQPGETVAVAVDEHGDLAKVKYIRSPLESYVYKSDGTNFTGEKKLRAPEVATRFEHGVIESSLFLDASKTGLPQAQILSIANIFAWDIDFARDIKSGDSFSVLYEEHFVDGERIGAGDILSAEFTNQGKTYQAVRFVGKDGTVTYYTPDGKPMRKAFLRAPLDFTRVSSNFNLRRFHPILKMVRPHRGVDYSAPTGTPVYAAGGGRIVAAAFSPSMGNYVVIQHNARYSTKYLHLSKRKVSAGKLVKQGETIGAVGSTGYATGPHLHYEFLINGAHQDPRSAKMPISEPIPTALRGQFLAQTRPLVDKLASLATRVASAKDGSSAAHID